MHRTDSERDGSSALLDRRRTVLLFSRNPDDPIDEGTLRLRIRLTVEPKFSGQAALQRLVFQCDFRMSAKVVSKGDGLNPLGTSNRHQMEMVSAKQCRR